MLLRCIECKRTFFKTLLHLDALKTFKTYKIILVFKNSIILSLKTKIFSILMLSNVEDLSLLRLNFLKISQLNSLKIFQTSQAVNVNIFILSKLVIFVTKTAATFITWRACVSSSMSSSAKLDWFDDENENEKNLDDNQSKTQAASKQFTKLTALMKRWESTKSKSSLSLKSFRLFMNMTVKYEVTLIISDILQITIDDENDVNLQDLH